MTTINVGQVLAGIKKLSMTERDELADELAQGSKDLKKIITDTFARAQSVHSGPINRDVCFFCGSGK
jgi:hypothetical protein